MFKNINVYEGFTACSQCGSDWIGTHEAQTKKSWCATCGEYSAESDYQEVHNAFNSILSKMEFLEGELDDPNNPEINAAMSKLSELICEGMNKKFGGLV